MHSEDVAGPQQGMEGEEIYTLSMGDFLKMPEVDFAELVRFDPHLRSLLN